MMLRTSLQRAACALAVAVYASGASAAGVYQDPAGEFRTPLPAGWTVGREAMSKQVCEGTATDIRSGRDPITQLDVRTEARQAAQAKLQQTEAMLKEAAEMMLAKEAGEAEYHDEAFEKARQQSVPLTIAQLRAFYPTFSSDLADLWVMTKTRPAAWLTDQKALALQFEHNAEIETWKGRLAIFDQLSDMAVTGNGPLNTLAWSPNSCNKSCWICQSQRAGTGRAGYCSVAARCGRSPRTNSF